MSNFEVFPPKYDVTLLKGKMFSMNKKGRNYRKGVPLSSALRNQVRELAQNHSFPEVGREYTSELHIWAGKPQSLTPQTFDVIWKHACFERVRSQVDANHGKDSAEGSKYQSWLNLQKNLYAATAIGFQMKRLVYHVELCAEKEKEPY